MNRETYPASQSPLTGDISAPAGATQATVVGIQNVPVVSGTPADQARLIYEAAEGEWVPSLPSNISVTLNGVPISDDYVFSCNDIGFEVLVNWSHGFSYKVFLNGTGFVGT